ncbi:ribonuclease P 40kDa subunit-domain-containing protein [Dichotomocladium elegans]|nr:ribonuclease P 40kDa subunit-domain-containing protein [Dichotomocladium elegans]
MSQSGYLPYCEQSPSYASLAYLGFDTHQKEWQRTIMTHPFNHKLSVFLPFCAVDQARNFFQDVQPEKYYKVQLSLASLLEPAFFTKYIHSDTHQLILHTADAQLETDDVVVLDDQGDLVFSLLKPTYQMFGLTTTQNRQDKLHQKYLLKVNLRELKPNSKMFMRLQQGLMSAFPQPIKMVAMYMDKETGETAEVIWPKDAETTEIPMELSYSFLGGINIPTFEQLSCNPGGNADLKVWQQDALNAIEWVGLANIRAKRILTLDTPQSFVSLYRSPTPVIESQQGVLIQVQGLLPPGFIRNVLVTVCKLMQNRSIRRWVSVSAWGYRDSPCTWGNMQHYYHLNGENDYTFLILPPAGQEQISMVAYCMLGSDHVQ